MQRVGTRLALFKPGTCRCRCSSSNSFHEPSVREVTSNSFGMAHLHRASQRRSLQDWSSVGEKKHTHTKTKNSWQSELTGLGEISPLHGMWMCGGAAAPPMCLCISSCHKTHALCRVLLLIYMLIVFIMQLSSLMG